MEVRGKLRTREMSWKRRPEGEKRVVLRPAVHGFPARPGRQSQTVLDAALAGLGALASAARASSARHTSVETGRRGTAST